jgi:gamma-glutamyltranspeptidase/glutathione hydrolase
MLRKVAAKKGVVSAGDPRTAEAGAEILKAGGNAYDAAIAATFMSFVVSSSITSAGGGGFLLAYPASGPQVLVDFFTQTPKVKRPVDELDFRPVVVDFGDKTQEFHIGMGTAAAPGNIAGLFAIHGRFGKLPMREIVKPALEAAVEGVRLHTQTKYQIDILEPILTGSEAGRRIYTKQGSLLENGERVYMPAFADLLDYLSTNGPREFYEGEIARKVAEDCLMSGGHLQLHDFTDYQVVFRKPLSIGYRRHVVHTNPFPNFGGPLIAFLLKILESVPMDKSDYHTPHHLNWLVQGIRLAATARSDIIKSGTRDDVLMKALLREDYLLSMREALHRSMRKMGNTTHVSAVDREYNIASVTTSVGEGCGYFIPGTDIMLNNMLGEEDLNTEGFHKWLPDARMHSMMAPTVVSYDGRPVMGLGSGGSNRIRSAIVQAIINHIDFRLDYDEVVNDPRVHWERGHLDVEPGIDTEAIEAIDLPQNNERFFWTKKNMYFGGVHAVFIDDNGGLHGAADRRRAGSVAYA